ncbi:MAG: hypothetical protein ABSF12_09130 [Bryobacteraceae bacterium]
MPDDERLEAISEALARLLRRQDEYQQQVDGRFARLEAAAGISSAPRVVSTPAPKPPPIPSTTTSAAPPPIPFQEATPPPASVPKPAAVLETRIGLNWFNIVGAT